MFARQCLRVRHISSLTNNFLLVSGKPVVDLKLPQKNVDKKCVASLSGLKFSATFASSADVTPPPVPIATYEEVLDLPNHPEVLLVDVREPSELKETGQIPTSINVPLGEVSAALSDATSSSAFLAKYGRQKPGANDPLVFMCKIGRRSEMASNEAIALGFKNVKNYRGSWLEWAAKNGLPQ